MASGDRKRMTRTELTQEAIDMALECSTPVLEEWAAGVRQQMGSIQQAIGETDDEIRKRKLRDQYLDIEAELRGLETIIAIRPDRSEK